MPALVESMFSVREVPWHGLGTIVQDAPSSEDAIRLAGLNWRVEEKKVYTEDGILIPSAVANVRNKDGKPLGIVGERYTIVQNEEAFKFTDELLGEGVTYETAGSLRDGKTIWLLAKLPNEYQILGDDVTPYIVFTNTHDGSGSVKVAMTPVRVVCNNTLNLALSQAQRTWSARHTGSIRNRLTEAQETLNLARNYMSNLNNEFNRLHAIELTNNDVIDLVNKIVPISDDAKDANRNNMQGIRDDILYRFNNAPDLRDSRMTGARLIQAVTDTASHIEPIRITAYAEENRMKKAIEGDKLLNKAMDLLAA